jgi:hypothetical protein
MRMKAFPLSDVGLLQGTLRAGAGAGHQPKVGTEGEFRGAMRAVSEAIAASWR